MLENQKISSGIADQTFYLKYLWISVSEPTTFDDESTQSFAITPPQECRLRDLTYSIQIRVNIEYIKGNQIIPKQNVEL